MNISLWQRNELINISIMPEGGYEGEDTKIDIEGWEHVIASKRDEAFKNNPETFSCEEQEWQLKLAWEGG